jgi:hypothetical protein
MEAFYWLLLLVVWLGGIFIAAAIYEGVAKSPYFEAEKRRRANERFKEIIND